MWETSELQTRQLSCVNRVIATRFADAEVTSLQDLKECDARKIEKISFRNFPFGEALSSVFSTSEYGQ